MCAQVFSIYYLNGVDGSIPYMVRLPTGPLGFDGLFRTLKKAANLNPKNLIALITIPCMVRPHSRGPRLLPLLPGLPPCTPRGLTRRALHPQAYSMAEQLEWFNVLVVSGVVTGSSM